jgi:hypothetical protein
MIAPDDQRDLVIRFFVCFSRFEYAMKAAGWVCAGKGDAAEPDWNRVVRQLKEADRAKESGSWDASSHRGFEVSPE